MAYSFALTPDTPLAELLTYAPHIGRLVQPLYPLTNLCKSTKERSFGWERLTLREEAQRIGVPSEVFVGQIGQLLGIIPSLR